jgi:single-stranded-DNA-specific exonuclease
MKKDFVWEILNTTSPKDTDELIEILIKSRSVGDTGFEKDIEHPGKFVEKYKEFFASAQNAAEEIFKTIKNDSPIIIHGDYDADGQTATAILWRTIYYDLNYQNVFPYIPNRFDEGYGLSEESLKGMRNLLEQKGLQIKDGIKQALIITVDCGITAVKEVELAKEMGFKIIISDHHHEAEKLPEPDFLVWTTKATGAGIAWVLSYLLRKNVANFNENKYLDLAALGTVCDLQPLLELNRAISKFGIEELNKNPSLGIKTLKESSEIKGNIDTYHLGWILGPKLNATGRLESAMDAIRLLCTEDWRQAEAISNTLNDLNKSRQDKTLADFLHAYKQVEPFAENKKFLIAKGDYHEGVIGLVAGRLMQSFYKPVIAISTNKETGLAKGSARSIEGVSIIEALNKFSDLFEKVGGHDMAAGFTIKEENIEKLNESLNSLEYDKDVFNPKLKIDTEINSKLINLETFEKLKSLAPFGPGNKEPMFLTKNFKVFNSTKFGKENQHLKLFLVDDNGQKHNGIMFNAPTEKAIPEGENITVVYRLSLNEWNGNKNIELNLQDFKKADA